jgi:hypothetical protein
MSWRIQRVDAFCIELESNASSRIYVIKAKLVVADLHLHVAGLLLLLLVGREGEYSLIAHLIDRLPYVNCDILWSYLVVYTHEFICFAFHKPMGYFSYKFIG